MGFKTKTIHKLLPRARENYGYSKFMLVILLDGFELCFSSDENVLKLLRIQILGQILSYKNYKNVTSLSLNKLELS
jgi:hypothetical protein